MTSRVFSCAEAKKMDLVDYLATLGYRPQKIRNEDYWYYSPLREEKTPSFKVNRKLNVWFDHGTGKGGNLLDFGVLYHQCSVRELLFKLGQVHPQQFSFHQPSLSPSNKEQQKVGAGEKEKIQILRVQQLQSPFLLQYLNERKIPFEIANKYLKEVHFELYNKRHTALGFPNNSGGFELRNASFKGSCSPKDFTTVKEHESYSNIIAVFEGLFDFLSHQTLLKKEHPGSLLHLPKEQSHFLILNSLSLFEKARTEMEKHTSIHLYLDRDTAGLKTTLQAIILGKQYHDKSHLYQNDKDLNEYLMSEGMEQKQTLKQGMRNGRRW